MRMRLEPPVQSSSPFIVLVWCWLVCGDQSGRSLPLCCHCRRCCCRRGRWLARECGDMSVLSMNLKWHITSTWGWHGDMGLKKICLHYNHRRVNSQLPLPLQRQRQRTLSVQRSQRSLRSPHTNKRHTRTMNSRTRLNRARDADASRGLGILFFKFNFFRSTKWSFQLDYAYKTTTDGHHYGLGMFLVFISLFHY